MPLSDEDVKALFSRLDTVVKLLAAMYARELPNNEAIVKLNKMDLSRDQIADAVNVTTHNVSQVLYAAKKDAENGEKKRAKADGKTAPLAEPIVEAVAGGESEIPAQ
jgi:hypothetical protein